jgi:hypothetical protein
VDLGRQLVTHPAKLSQAHGWPMKPSIVFEVWPLMSIPSSAMTAIDSGRTPVASVPPLATSKRSPAHARSIPSAIWERAELWTHTNRTRRLVMGPA